MVIPALAANGVEAVPRVWDDPTVHWSDYRLVVVRSTWDYAEQRDDFLRWSASVPRVLNTQPVLEWNTSKTYLRDLAAAGIPVVPTTWLDPGTAALEIAPPPEELVVKPVVSAGARNTSRYRAEDRQLVTSHIKRLLADGRTVMVQPYVTSVDEYGETALIYISGTYSHSIRKGPVLRQHAYATSELWAPEEITTREPRSDERELAEDTLDALQWARSDLLYARADIVRGADGEPMLLELELTEPSLFFAYGSGAATRLADAITHRLKTV